MGGGAGPRIGAKWSQPGTASAASRLRRPEGGGGHCCFIKAASGDEIEPAVEQVKDFVVHGARSRAGACTRLRTTSKYIWYPWRTRPPSE